MNKITDYTTLEEKIEFFSLNKKIDSKQDVDQLFQQLLKFKNTDHLNFRGLPEAKFKLYNSAQRYYKGENIISGRDYDSFIEKNIELAKVWNNSTIKNYLSQRGIQDNCFAYLSIMQHNKVPTPLVDFTKNPFVALFFSSDSNVFDDKNEIEQYSSLYFVNSQYWMIDNAFQNFFQQWTRSNEKGVIKYQDVKHIPFMLLNSTNEKFQILNNISI